MTNTPGIDGGKHVTAQPLTTDAANAASSELLRNSIDQKIVKIRPSATPIDQISRMVGSRRCSSMKVDYYSVDTKKTEASVSAGANQDEGIETLPDGTTTYTVSINEAGIFDPSDTLIVAGEEGTGGKPLMCYVLKVDGASITLIPVNASENTEIPDGATLVRMGRAATELDVQSPQFQAMPMKRRNNCQIFKMQVEQSVLQKLADKEVGWTLTDQEEAAIIDMRLGMEKSFLAGFGTTIDDPIKGEKVYLTEGIWNQTDNKMSINLATLGEKDVIDICSRVFTHNNGSKSRILLAGTGLVEALSKLTVSRQLDVRDPRAKWGVEAREIVTNFGHLHIIHSEVFDQCGHRNDGFVLDPDYVTKYTHIPFHAEQLDLRASGTRNTEAVVLTEASCMVLRYPKSHLKLIAKTA